MERKFQVWVDNTWLIGHLIGYTKEEAEERKYEYAKEVWNDKIKPENVSLCEVCG